MGGGGGVASVEYGEMTNLASHACAGGIGAGWVFMLMENQSCLTVVYVVMNYCERYYFISSSAFAVWSVSRCCRGVPSVFKFVR